MKKIWSMVTIGVFLLSLQGGALAQKEEKRPMEAPKVEKPAEPKKEAPKAKEEKAEKAEKKATKERGLKRLKKSKPKDDASKEKSAQ